jgi:hypothetical protein
MMPLLCKWDLYVIFGGIVNEQAKGNAILQASLERRKQALHDRRLALEQDVSISIVVSVANANIFLVSFRS